MENQRRCLTLHILHRQSYLTDGFLYSSIGRGTRYVIIVNLMPVKLILVTKNTNMFSISKIII